MKVPSALVVVVLVLTIVIPIAASSDSAANTGNSTDQSATVYFFYGDGCPHCAIVEPLIESLAAKYPQVNFIKLEVWHNSANQALFQNFNAQYGVQNPAVPTVFIGGQVLVAENAIESSLEPIIQSLINTNTVSQSSSSTQSAGASASTNPLPSKNVTNSSVEVTKSAPEAPTVIEKPSSETKYNNSTSSPNIKSVQAANSVEATKPASEASTIIKAADPEIKFSTANDAVFNSSQVAIEWNYTSGQSDVTTAEVTIDGGTFESISRDATSYVVGGLSEGKHAFDLRITDKNGLSSEHSLNFSVDPVSESNSGSSSSPFLIGFASFILIVGLSLVFVQRIRRKA